MQIYQVWYPFLISHTMTFKNFKLAENAFNSPNLALLNIGKAVPFPICYCWQADKPSCVSSPWTTKSRNEFVSFFTDKLSLLLIQV